MLAGFRSVFHPTEEETKREQERLMEVRNKGIAEKACPFCKHGQMYVLGHGEYEFRCRKTKKTVTFEKGRGCFEEEE